MYARFVYALAVWLAVVCGLCAVALRAVALWALWAVGCGAAGCGLRGYEAMQLWDEGIS